MDKESSESDDWDPEENEKTIFDRHVVNYTGNQLSVFT